MRASGTSSLPKASAGRVAVNAEQHSPPQLAAKSRKRGSLAGAPASQHPNRRVGSNASQGADADANSSKAAQSKGRPKRNVVADALKTASDFVAAGPDDKTFLGTGQKSMIQWLQRLVEAFDDRMEDEDLTPEGNNEFILHNKIVQVVSAVCTAARKSGVESEEFLDVAYKQTQFLAMAPCVETNVFPSFVRLSAKKSVVERAEAGPEWWALLAPAELSLGDYAVSMGQLHMMQIELVANKVVAMQSQSKAEFRDQIAKLFGDMSAIKAAQLSNETMEQIEAIAMVVRLGVGSEA